MLVLIPVLALVSCAIDSANWCHVMPKPMALHNLKSHDASQFSCLGVKKCSHAIDDTIGIV